MSDENANVETPEVADHAVNAAADTAKPAAKGAAGKTAAAAESSEERKFRLKYGKEEREMTERELIAAAQKGWAADDRFQQASKMQKEMLEAAKGANMDDLVRKLKGMDPMEFYKEQLKAELRRRTLSPQERALAEQEAKLNKLKAEEKEILTKREQEKLSQMEQHYIQQYDKDLTAAIEKNGLPKNRVAIKRAADIAAKVVDMGLDPDWDLVVQEAKRQILGEVNELMGGYRDEELLSLFGEDFPKRIGKAVASRGQVVGRAQKPKVEGEKAGEEKDPSQKPVDMKQWMRDQRKKFEEG